MLPIAIHNLKQQTKHDSGLCDTVAKVRTEIPNMTVLHKLSYRLAVDVFASIVSLTYDDMLPYNFIMKYSDNFEFLEQHKSKITSSQYQNYKSAFTVIEFISTCQRGGRPLPPAFTKKEINQLYDFITAMCVGSPIGLPKALVKPYLNFKFKTYFDFERNEIFDSGILVVDVVEVNQKATHVEICYNLWKPATAYMTSSVPKYDCFGCYLLGNSSWDIGKVQGFMRTLNYNLNFADYRIKENHQYVMAAHVFEAMSAAHIQLCDLTKYTTNQENTHNHIQWCNQLKFSVVDRFTQYLVKVGYLTAGTDLHYYTMNNVHEVISSIYGLLHKCDNSIEIFDGASPVSNEAADALFADEVEATKESDSEKVNPEDTNDIEADDISDDTVPEESDALTPAPTSEPIESPEPTIDAEDTLYIKKPSKPTNLVVEVDKSKATYASYMEKERLYSHVTAILNSKELELDQEARQLLTYLAVGGISLFTVGTTKAILEAVKFPIHNDEYTKPTK